MERVELRRINLINGTTQQQEERGNVARGGRTGTFYLKAINHSCCFFPWETNKHDSHHTAVGAAFPASRMTDRVKALRTGSQCEASWKT